MAAIANAAHGVPLVRSDYLNVFHAYIKARKHRTNEGGFKSYREIARELGGTRRHTTISLWMHKHYPAVAQRMQKDPVEGPREEEAIDRDEANQQRLVEEIQAALAHIKALAKGLNMPESRGQAVADTRDALKEIEGGGEWVEPWI